MRFINLDILLGFIVGLGASVVFATPWAWEHSLHDYQELVVGGLSLVSAAAAFVAVMCQIDHAQKMEDERRNRSLISARIVLPNALIAIREYAENCGAALRRSTNEMPLPDCQYRVTLCPDRIPAIPESSLPILRECAQFGDKDLQYCITKLCQDLQVLAARLRQANEVGENDVNKRYFYGLVEYVIGTYARSNMLFSYYHMNADCAPCDLTFENMRDAAVRCGFDLSQWNELEQQIRRRYPQS